MKRCNKCGEEFPATVEYFNKSSDNQDGLRGECKGCRKNYNKLYKTPEFKQEMAEREAYLLASKTKKCIDCGKELPRTSEYFYIRTDTKFGFRNECKACTVNNRRIYVSENKDIVANNRRQYRLDNIKVFTERDRKYRQLNHDAVTKRKKKYYIEHYDVVIEYQRRYNIENVDKVTEIRRRYYQTNKDRSAELSKRWRINHPEEMRIHRERRRLRELALPCTFTAEQWRESKIYFNNKCAFCEKEVPLTMEHVTCVNKGGEFTKDNIIPSCQSCNSRKRTQDCMVWFRKQPEYTFVKEVKILKYLGYKNGKQQLSLF